ncbi:MAG: glycosyltransferase [Asticcacaulis sp.]
MLRLRHLPLKYRLPLIHGGLNVLGRIKALGWQKANPEAPKTGDFVASGFFQETTGIAQGGRLSLKAFDSAGYKMQTHDLRPCFRHILFGGLSLPGHDGVWYIHANAPEVLVALMAHDPKSWGHRYRIAYWAWETPKAPRGWLFVADYLHEIWVPSQFVHDALAAMFNDALRADLIPRLRVMPHPVPIPPAGRDTEARHRFGLRDDVCEVLCLFDTKSSAVRKNPWGALEAWQVVFPTSQDQARLTLKVSDLSDDKATAQRLQTLLYGRSDIRLISERLSERDMEAFVGAFDVLISLHRSEGFGLSLAEAMAAGVVVIATGWSGNTDFMTQKNARLIGSSLVAIHDPEGGYGGLLRDPAQVWAEPDPEAASAALRDLTGSEALRAQLKPAALKAIRALHVPWQPPALSQLPFNNWLKHDA